MKLAVSTYSLSRWRREQKKSVEDTLKFIQSTGASAVEFAGLDDGPVSDPIKRAKALKKRCGDLGLEIAGYCVGANLLQPKDKQREVIDRVKVDVDVAAVLGVKSMRHDVCWGWSKDSEGISGPQTFGNALKVVVPALREITEHGAKVGVITTLENHGFFMQHSTRVEKLIKAVNHPNYALTMDMGNFLCVNENPVSAVRRLAKRAVMVHAKDFFVKPKTALPPTGWFATPTKIGLRGAIVGHGVIDIPAQLQLVKKANYKGYLSLEFEGMEEPTVAVQLGLNYLKGQLEKIGALG